MEENKNHHEEKSNTGMIIAAIILIFITIGLIAYFAMGNDVTDAIDDVKDTTENIIENDNDTKTINDVIGSYQAKIGASAGIDEDTPADEDDYIELVLKEDGTSSLVITTKSKNTITGSYTISDNVITVTSDEDTIDDTYQFNINDDNSLNYINDNNTITLSKVDNNNLKYIK